MTNITKDPWWRFDLSKTVCSHLVGEKHNHIHKKIVGFVICFIGVTIAHFFAFIDAEIIKYFLDLTGYGVHGIGLIPYVESVLKYVNE